MIKPSSFSVWCLRFIDLPCLSPQGSAGSRLILTTCHLFLWCSFNRHRLHPQQSCASVTCWAFMFVSSLRTTILCLFKKYHIFFFKKNEGQSVLDASSAQIQHHILLSWLMQLLQDLFKTQKISGVGFYSTGSWVYSANIPGDVRWLRKKSCQCVAVHAKGTEMTIWCPESALPTTLSCPIFKFTKENQAMLASLALSAKLCLWSLCPFHMCLETVQTQMKLSASAWHCKEHRPQTVAK